ncbi:MAG: DUF11 domain-containing protein, partial [Acidobacteriota bacterium]|nr:DUF11 domain-containing protein [Acidobacteriota bacterium]
PTLPGYLDLQYTGVAYDPARDLLLFGVSTWGPWSSPSDVAVNIYIDSTGSGTFDKILFNSNPGSIAGNLFGNPGANPQDTFINAVFDLNTFSVSTVSFLNGASAAGVDSRVFDNNVMVLAASPASLGLTGTAFRYRIETCPGFAPLCSPLNGFRIDAADGPFKWNYAAASQGLSFGGLHLAEDLPGQTLPVTFNTANLTSNGSLGALLLHHHNVANEQAQVVPVEGSPWADLVVTNSVIAPYPAPGPFGLPVLFTVVVSNHGPNAASGVQVLDPLPGSLSLLSQTGGSAYDPSTGIWSVGSLKVGQVKVLNIIAKVTASGAIDDTAQIVAGTPLDPNPANNQSTVTISAARQADVALAITASSSSVLPGQPVTFTLTVRNNGDDPAYNVRVSELFRDFTPPQSFKTTAGVFDPAAGVWKLASLAKGASETLQMTIRPAYPTLLVLSAIASSSTGDPNFGNNIALVTVKVGL